MCRRSSSGGPLHRGDQALPADEHAPEGHRLLPVVYLGKQALVHCPVGERHGVEFSFLAGRPLDHVHGRLPIECY